jgi:sugar diacid utilization regulator
MTASHQYPESWIERFRADPAARQVILDLESRSPEIWRRTFAALSQQSPEYRNAVDDEFTVESRSHCTELLGTIVAIASGEIERTDPFAFVRRHAEWRARHQVPLVASLHAYRLAHKTYWQFTREALAGQSAKKGALRALATLSDFWLELFEVVGTVLEEAHVGEEARIVAQNSHAYAALMDQLLRGAQPSDRDGQRLARLFGIREGLALAVVLVRTLTTDGKPVDREVSLRSRVRLMQQQLPSSVFGKVIEVRSEEIVAIVSAPRNTAAQVAKILSASEAAQAADEAPTATGISLDKPAIADLPDGLAEARIALELADSTRPLVCFGRIDLLDFLIRRADRAALRLVPDWARDAHLSNGRSVDLLGTIRAFAECDLSVKNTARRLQVHPNTVYFRLNQIKERTGVDPRTFAGTSFLLTALRLSESQAPR